MVGHRIDGRQKSNRSKRKEVREHAQRDRRCIRWRTSGWKAETRIEPLWGSWMHRGANSPVVDFEGACLWMVLDDLESGCFYIYDWFGKVLIHLSPVRCTAGLVRTSLKCLS